MSRYVDLSNPKIFHNGRDKYGNGIYHIPPDLPTDDVVERKKGTWIKKMRVTETEKYISYEPEWYCPCCGTKYDPHIAKVVNFCYVCGLDMREREEK